MVIPTEIKLVFDEVEMPRQPNATGASWLLTEERKANPTARKRMTAPRRQADFVMVVITVILVRTIRSNKIIGRIEFAAIRYWGANG